MESVLQWLIANPMWLKAVASVIGLGIIAIITLVIRMSVTRWVKENDTRYRLRKFITFVAYILAVLMLSLFFRNQLGGVTVALGVAGAGIAFALQELIASIAGWFTIHFAHFYKTGDRVEVGGIKGDVIDISFLRTVVMEVGEWVHGDLYTGRVVRVANSFVFKAPVYNYSGEFPFLWDEITIPVRYGSDHRMARQILNDVASRLLKDYAEQAEVSWGEFSKLFLLEDALTMPQVTMVANDNWIEFTLRYVVEFKHRRSMKDTLFTAILDEVDKSDGKVQMASATFELVDAPPIQVTLKSDSRA
jgi:small-conductance mechanosensitive channel